MSQPIDAGAMLGGRYQVTELVLTSADGDQVLSGIDQVLNRPVSILVGSTGAGARGPHLRAHARRPHPGPLRGRVTARQDPTASATLPTDWPNASMAIDIFSLSYAVSSR